jgi:glycogen operon protein
MPKCRVVDTAFSWGDDRPPRTPWHNTVIYELHVKGFTARHPDIPPRYRGTYAGLGSAPAIEYLKRLGVTAIELMPVHTFVDDRVLVEKGLKNYWGYNSIGFFSPDMRYSATGYLAEFKSMVKCMHSAGIEVILDVVYNHSAEGSHMGPTLSLRGIDNSSYYRLSPEDPRYYVDFTGCGNTLNMLHPRVIQLIMDSLRYWAVEMHVDGFRFDLAATLARELYEVDRLSAFFEVIHQDPILSQMKLIAEPWDLGPGGFQVGNFPIGWAEWNGKYRDAVRSYWKGEGGQIGELAYRLTGSSDLYEQRGRRPFSSINFVTCHDGFTLHDLVSYNDKHNEANGEENRDGESNNRSWNCGAEGPTSDTEITALRERQKRNFLSLLVLSQGVLMIPAGDEFGRTQHGNNNAYCQDNELSWINWELSHDAVELQEFVRNLLTIRREHPTFRRRRFFQGRAIKGAGGKDITWLTPDGQEMTDREWDQAFARCLGVYLAGAALEEDDDRGRAIQDDDFLVLINSHHEPIPFLIRPTLASGEWRALVDTSFETAPGRTFRDGNTFPLAARSLALLMRPRAAIASVAPARRDSNSSSPGSSTRTYSSNSSEDPIH